MNLTELRGRPQKRKQPRPAKSEPKKPSPDKDDRLGELTRWLDEFCRLHQVSVQVLDGDGRPVIPAQGEPLFCAVAKRERPGGCPDDCGRKSQGIPRSLEPHLFQCPYHLSNISWVVRAENGTPWTVIMGRTLATQEQMSNCLEALHDTEEFDDDALAALGSIPWQAEPELVAGAEFLKSTLELILRAPVETAKSKDPRGSRRKSQRG